MSKHPKQSSSRRALGKALGVTHQTVGQWLEHSEWTFGRKPPWDVEAVEAWRAETLKPDANAVDALELPAPTDRAPERAAKLKVLVERGLKLELENKIKTGQYIERAFAVAQWALAVAHVRAALLAIPRQFAAELATLAELPLERRLSDILHGAMTELADSETVATTKGRA